MTYDHTGKQRAVVPLPAATAAENKPKCFVHLCYILLLVCNAHRRYMLPMHLYTVHVLNTQDESRKHVAVQKWSYTQINFSLKVKERYSERIRQ